MTVTEHPGPKGQVFLKGTAEPLWFSSVRDTLAFTMLPGEPRTVAALYVNDMSGAADWTAPSPGAWVLADDAVFVAGGTAVDRKSVVEGQSVSVRVDRGGRRLLKKKTTIHSQTNNS